MRDHRIPSWIRAQECDGLDPRTIAVELKHEFGVLQYQQSRCLQLQAAIEDDRKNLLDAMQYVAADVKHEQKARKALNILTISNASSPAATINSKSLENIVALSVETMELVEVMHLEIGNRNQFCMVDSLAGMLRAWDAARFGMISSTDKVSRREVLVSFQEASLEWHCG